MESKKSLTRRAPETDGRRFNRRVSCGVCADGSADCGADRKTGCGAHSRARGSRHRAPATAAPAATNAGLRHRGPDIRRRQQEDDYPLGDQLCGQPRHDRPDTGYPQEVPGDYPDVTIEIEESPGNGYQTKIKLDASSDRLPDVFNYWRMNPAFGLDQIVDAGKVADISEWTKTDPFFKVC